MSAYQKKGDTTEAQKEAYGKLERKVLEQGEVIQKQSLRIKELENLVEQRENELAHLKRIYELEIQNLGDLLNQLKSQSEDQINKIKSLEIKMKDESDDHKYREEDLTFKIRSLEKRITELESQAREKDEIINELNQQLDMTAARISDLEKTIKDKDSKLASIESLMVEDVNYKPYFIVKKYGSSNIQDIKKTLGLQEGTVRRIVFELEKKGLVRVDGDHIYLV